MAHGRYQQLHIEVNGTVDKDRSVVLEAHVDGEYAGELVLERPSMWAEGEEEFFSPSHRYDDFYGVSNIEILKPYRRSGLATLLLKRAEELVGYQVEPNTDLTREGKALFSSRKV